MPWLHLDEKEAGRALDIQRQLAGVGRHRRSIPDLLVAVAVEAADRALAAERPTPAVNRSVGQSLGW